MQEEGIRLNKFLSGAGVCSRREADRLIESGQVLVDGKPAAPGQKVFPKQKIVCQGQTFQPGDRETSCRPRPVLLAVHKPRGVVCTTSDKDRAPNIVSLVGYPARVYPVGRLDKDSEGLILMTNQGELVNAMMRGSNGHEKEYIVTVDKPVTQEFIHQMEAGVFLSELKVRTKPCRLRKTGKTCFHIILTQGLNRQIRRMCACFGYRVETLKRIRIMNLELGNLRPGEWRMVTDKECQRLMELLNHQQKKQFKSQRNESDKCGNRKDRMQKKESFHGR